MADTQRLADTQRPPQTGLAGWQAVGDQPVRVSYVAGTSGAGQSIPPSDRPNRQQKALESFRETIEELARTRQQLATLSDLRTKEARLIAEAQAGHKYCLELGLDVGSVPGSDNSDDPLDQPTATLPVKSGRRQSKPPALANVSANVSAPAEEPRVATAIA